MTAAAVHVTPASGSITHLSTACRVTLTDGVDNDMSAWASPTDANDYPTAPAVTYYFKFAKSGQDDLISPVFTPASDGKAEWNGVILPAAGTWTLTANFTEDDSVYDTASVVVA
jgi:hypothetical protein